MAYDPNDPKDKAIVDKLVKDAVEAREAELAEEHEAATEGLKNKNKDLVKRLAKAKEANGGEDNSDEVARLEAELADSKKALKTLERDYNKAKGELDSTRQSLQSETQFSERMLKDGGLRDALTKANVSPHLLDGALALLSGQVTIKQDGESRVAVVGDKSLSDFVKEWSQGDQGKPYIAAPVNGGGNASGGGSAATGAKTMSRADFAAKQPSEQAKFMAEGGSLTDD